MSDTPKIPTYLIYIGYILPILTFGVGIYQFSIQQKKELSRNVQLDFNQSVKELYETKYSKISSVSGMIFAMSKNPEIDQKGQVILSSYLKNNYNAIFSFDGGDIKNQTRFDSCRKIPMKEQESFSYIIQYIVSRGILNDQDSYFQDISQIYNVRIYGKDQKISQPMTYINSTLHNLEIIASPTIIRCSATINSKVRNSSYREMIYFENSGAYKTKFQNVSFFESTLSDVVAEGLNSTWGTNIYNSDISTISSFKTSFSGSNIIIQDTGTIEQSEINDSIVIINQEDDKLDNYLQKNTISNSTICVNTNIGYTNKTNKLINGTKIFVDPKDCPRELPNGKLPKDVRYTFNMKEIIYPYIE